MDVMSEGIAKTPFWCIRNIINIFASVMLALSFGGCATKTPDCADSQTTDLIKQIVDNTIEGMGTVFQIGNLLPKEWIKDLDIKVENIRTVSYDQNIDKYTCSAQIKITDTKATKPTGEAAALGLIHEGLSSEGVTVRYTSEIMADKKQHYVEIQDMEELQQALIMLGSMRKTFGASEVAPDQAPPTSESVTQSQSPVLPQMLGTWGKSIADCNSGRFVEVSNESVTFHNGTDSASFGKLEVSGTYYGGAKSDGSIQTLGIDDWSITVNFDAANNFKTAHVDDLPNNLGARFPWSDTDITKCH